LSLSNRRRIGDWAARWAFDAIKKSLMRPAAGKVILPLKNVTLAECFNSDKENRNDENIRCALHARIQTKDRPPGRERPKHRSGEGWLFVAVVIALFNRQVVGGSLREGMSSSIAIDALRMAALVQQSPAVFDTGLRQPDTVRTNVACGSAQASQFMLSFRGYGIQRQGQWIAARSFGILRGGSFRACRKPGASIWAL
jgi:hypothetical protein